MKKRYSIYIALACLIGGFSACKKSEDPQGGNDLPLPVIASVSATEGAAGQTITITGQNFSTDEDVYKVQFVQQTENCNGLTNVLSVDAEVLSVSETSITVKVPGEGFPCVGFTNATIKVTNAAGATTFSETFYYRGIYSFTPTSTSAGQVIYVTVNNGRNDNKFYIDTVEVTPYKDSALSGGGNMYFITIPEAIVGSGKEVKVFTSYNRELLDTTGTTLTTTAYSGSFTLGSASGAGASDFQITVNNSFGFSNVVRFGTNSVTIQDVVQVDANTQILKLKVPLLTPGTYTVTVATPTGTMLTVSGSNQFTIN